VLYYSHNIPQEAAMTSDEFDVKAGTSFGGTKAIHTTKEWPESGSVTLSNLQMRYRTETPLVLKGLNVSIGAGERIGVVGRTGSGKSSMLLVLMRIVEPLISEDGEKYEAPLSIDGVDVMRIGLYDLRSKLGIIPQSPGETFSGGMPYA
jgi:ABC-type multidrug transport system fused ATPase/permease subunit